MISVKKVKNQQGFNLMELLVIVSIIAMVNMVIFAGYPKFNRRIALKKTTAEIALAVRQAQSNSLAVKKFDKSVSNPFPDYGIHFEKDKNNFTIFADTNNSRTYGGASADCSDTECVEFFSINNSTQVGTVELCQKSSSCASYQKVDIVYPRGRTAVIAYVRGVDASGGVYECSSCSYARIRVDSLGNLVPPKYLYVWFNGQISIKDN
ncbi:MAG: hypothetical protein L6Q29_00930 [Candidatus Pacebacteria bacterium]|nr:hypothetical protein [Candidatus Paceibacterota bacterium]